MKQIEEQELDQLITASFERQDVLDDISLHVMKDIRHSARRAALRRWVRLTAFAFGVPFVLGCFGYGVSFVYRHVAMQPAVVIGLILSVITMIAVAEKTIDEFPVREM